MKDEKFTLAERNDFLVIVYDNHLAGLLAYTVSQLYKRNCILDADDLVFGFLCDKVLLQWEKFKQKLADDNTGYLFTALRNYINDQARLKCNKQYADLPDEAEDDTTEEEDNNINEHYPFLMMDIKNILGDRDFDIFYQRHVNGYSSMSIAKNIDLSASGTRGSLSRSLKKLRKRLPAHYQCNVA